MTAPAPPTSTDMKLDVFPNGDWRVVCPPRLRGRLAAQGAAGVVAGFVLGLVSAAGLAQAFAHSSWGMTLFLLGWMVPLAVIALLLVWLGITLALRVWQSDVLESTAGVVRHRRVGPGGGRTLFEARADLIEPLGPPTIDDIPELDDPDVQRLYRAPIVLAWRRGVGGDERHHLWLASATWDEHRRLAAAINPRLRAAGQPSGEVR